MGEEIALFQYYGILFDLTVKRFLLLSFFFKHINLAITYTQEWVEVITYTQEWVEVIPECIRDVLFVDVSN